MNIFGFKPEAEAEEVEQENYELDDYDQDDYDYDDELARDQDNIFKMPNIFDGSDLFDI